MSMLTPPGMGGQYRITGDKYPRMRPPRRRGRLVFGLVASAAVLGLTGWGTLQLIDVFTGDGKKASAPGSKADCTTKASPSPATAAALPEPGSITVNVYNATPRSGLAKDTADELKKRGFRIGEVGNASPEFDKKIKGTGILLGSSSARDTSMPVLATQLATAERHTDVTRKDKGKEKGKGKGKGKGTELDLILGNGFKTLTKKADADRALARLTAPRTTAADTEKSC